MLSREEAKDRLLNSGFKGYVQKEELIDEIYDGLESRTCDNCKFYKEENISCESEIEDVLTGCDQIYVETNYALNLENFGCNKWEKKDVK